VVRLTAAPAIVGEGRKKGQPRRTSHICARIFGGGRGGADYRIAHLAGAAPIGLERGGKKNVQQGI